MEIRGLTHLELIDCANRCAVRLENIRPTTRGGTGFKLVLRPVKMPDSKLNYWQRLNYRLDRKVAAVCWHGHRAFMWAVFDVNPNAVIITSQIRYTGRENFEETHAATGLNMIGRQAEPCYYRDACDYETHIEANTDPETTHGNAGGRVY